ncbi:MAG: SMP-30/gluconolactonase/LRE family protein [Verrucomicrobiota bacterium]
MSRLTLLLTLAPTLLHAAESVERLDPALDAIIPPETPIKTLCTGFDWSEGPVWDAKDQQLLFSDVPRNTIYAWREGESEAREWMKPSGFTGVDSKGRSAGSNGLAIDAKGRLVLCEHGDRRVAVLTPEGGKLTLADHFEGKRFNSPNDLTIHSNGDIYFTDPPYGLANQEVGRELDFFGVYRLATDGSVTLLVRDLERPNGIALSPDEKTLYVAQSHRPLPVIMAYPVQDDGSVGEGRVFFDTRGLEGPGLPDGMKVRSDGTVFATGPGGLLIISPEGKLLGRILCGRSTANVAFGPDESSLFLTADDRVLKVALAAAAK